MNSEKPNLKKQQENQALARVKKTVSDKALDLSPEELASSPWYSLAKFFNNSAKEIIPRNEEDQKYQKFIAPIHQKCVQVIKTVDSEDWDEIIENNFEYAERKAARDFFFFISTKPGQKRTDAIAPDEVLKDLKKNLNNFVQLSPYAFIASENTDLVKLHSLAEIMSSYKRSERTFLFLSELPSLLDNKSRKIIEKSQGYQEILSWGASKFLNRLWQRLQEHFGINIDEVSEETLYNLLRELEQKTEYLKKQVEQLEIENQDLKNTIEFTRSQSLQQAAYTLAQTLQQQPQPVLDQIFLQYQKLNKLSESGQKLSLSETDFLVVKIILDALLTAFKSLNITPYPSNLEQSFKLEHEQMGEYIYVEGSAFSNLKDAKIVCCIRPGWRVGQEIVTPARVKEITA